MVMSIHPHLDDHVILAYGAPRLGLHHEEARGFDPGHGGGGLLHLSEVFHWLGVADLMITHLVPAASCAATSENRAPTLVVVWAMVAYSTPFPS
jgi:hypothetical protein